MRMVHILMMTVYDHLNQNVESSLDRPTLFAHFHLLWSTAERNSEYTWRMCDVLAHFKAQNTKTFHERVDEYASSCQRPKVNRAKVGCSLLNKLLSKAVSPLSSRQQLQIRITDRIQEIPIPKFLRIETTYVTTSNILAQSGENTQHMTVIPF